MGISFVIVVLILTSVLKRYTSDGLFLVVGLVLENSGLSMYDTRCRQNGYPNFGMGTLVALWTILIGTILVNWYKTCFTMEMIVPSYRVRITLEKGDGCGRDSTHDAF